MSKDIFLDTILKLELDKINENIPQRRVSIEEILQKKPYAIPTKKNTEIVIPTKEIEEFISFFDETLYSDIRIPIVLISVKDTAKVGGSKMDHWVIEKLFGYNTENVVFLQSYEPKHNYYYSYQVNRLKKRFPNVIQVVYSL